MQDRNGYFKIINKPDGTYIRIIPPDGNGRPVRFEEVTRYIESNRIGEYNQQALSKILKTAKTMTDIRLNSMDAPVVDEAVKILVSEDKMRAVARFYPPSDDGKDLNYQSIIDAIEACGIRYGIDKENIDNYISNRLYCTDYIIANGKNVREGHDAKIIYNFNTNPNTKPKHNEDGTVNWHQLDMINHVKAGAVVATILPEDQGEEGINVLGIVTKPKKVQKKNFKYGKNLYVSEDGLNLITEISGHVSLETDKVFVSNTYQVPADVDNSTGDIEYDGNVIVTGNVIAGFSIKATGDIIVNGVVEGANLEAGGQIILQRGVQGMSKGRLKAGGNIVSKFMENANAISGGYIEAEAILHSNITAKSDIIVSGKKGLIIGGYIRSGTMIEAKTIGNMMETATIVEVGIDPAAKDKVNRLRIKMQEQSEEKFKLKQVITLLQKKQQNEGISEEKLKKLQAATKQVIVLDQTLKALRKDYDELLTELDEKEDACIRVTGTIYPGTKIIVSDANRYLKTQENYCKFVKEAEEVVRKPL